jgi:hypothetical protein
VSAVGDWLARLTRFHHYHYPVVGIGMLLAAVVLGEPGTHDVVLGPLRVDAYWLVIASSLVLILLSVTDAYDPADYGLDREE